MEKSLNFQAHPSTYKHWKLDVKDRIAWLGLKVSEDNPANAGYELKLNSYDISVDIELNDAVQRLRFEYPSVGCVILHSRLEKIFCAGANIRMLAMASHELKVNFCKFTNETRIAIENAGKYSNQKYICAIEGACAGGGYELALACDEIIMVNDGSTTVSLPEVPLLGVLPGTGGLTRIVDKRGVRKDIADFFCTTEEGITAKKALDWNFVDAIESKSSFKTALNEKADQFAKDKPSATGIQLSPLDKFLTEDGIKYKHLKVELDRKNGSALLRVMGPSSFPDKTIISENLNDSFWPLSFFRELDDAILSLRFNEPEICTWVFSSTGDADAIKAFDDFMYKNTDNWFINETTLLIQRVLNRLELSARSIITTINQGSCFHGFLFEIALASDQIFMLEGKYEDSELPLASISISKANTKLFQTLTGLNRLKIRFLKDKKSFDRVINNLYENIETEKANDLGLVTFTPDDIDWDDEIRLTIQSRAGYSGDALTGLEANLRFPGPETMESKIFSRLSAWQNWIFQRPNSTGEEGTLAAYGSGRRPQFSKKRT